MWLFTTFGFFSIVQKTKGDVLTVRARLRGDLERLRDHYIPTLSPTEVHEETDYRYRARASRAAVAAALRRIAEDIRYSNFKDAVGDELGSEREALCEEVWTVMHRAQLREKPASRRAAPGPAGAIRYGSVVFNEKGELLLFESRDHYGGYAGPSPKERPSRARSPRTRQHGSSARRRTSPLPSSHGSRACTPARRARPSTSP